MSIRGNLETMELEGLLQWVAQGRKSGTLVVKNTRDEKRLVFQTGTLISTFSTNPHEHVCRFLLDRELIDRDRLRVALDSNRGNSLQLGRALVESGDLPGQALQEVLEFRAEETVRDLLEWPDGDFHFLDGERPKILPVTISLEVTPLLLRVADRMDRLRHAAETAPAVASVGGGRPVSHGQLALVPGADPITDELPVISAAPQAEPVAEEIAEPSQDRSKLLFLAVAAVFVFGAALAFFLMGRSSTTSTEPASQPIVAADPIAQPSPEPVVEQLEAQILSLQAQLGTLIEETATADANDSSRYEEELARLRSELVAARSAALEVSAPAEAPVGDETSVGADPTEGDSAVEGPVIEPVVASTEQDLSDARVGSMPAPAGELSSQGSVDASVLSADELAVDSIEIGSTTTLGGAGTLSSSPSAPLNTTPEAPETSVGGADFIAVPGPGVVPPEIVRSPKARYPPLARRMKREASVQVEVLVGLNGRAEEVRTSGPDAGLGFDTAALTVARGSRWNPATVDGEPARMWTAIRVDFRNNR